MVLRVESWESGSEILREFCGVVLEKVGEGQLDRSREK